MWRLLIAVLACVPVASCGGPETPLGPTATTTQANNDATSVTTPGYLVGPTPPGIAPTVCPALGFEDVGAPGAAVTSYVRCGFTVAASGANWTAWTGYGKPAPFIGFMSGGGSTTTGEVRLTSAAGTFTFQSVDIYSSTTKIPYVITGFVNGAVAFTIDATQPNTFGKFATVVNPNSARQVDTLVIRLTNPASPCCANPVGLDNIVVK